MTNRRALSQQATCQSAFAGTRNSARNVRPSVPYWDTRRPNMERVEHLGSPMGRRLAWVPSFLPPTDSSGAGRRCASLVGSLAPELHPPRALKRRIDPRRGAMTTGIFLMCWVVWASLFLGATSVVTAFLPRESATLVLRWASSWPRSSRSGGDANSVKDEFRCEFQAPPT